MNSSIARLIVCLLAFTLQCHGHSNECYYNPEVDQRGLSLNTDGVYSGGGVCLNCTVSIFTHMQRSFKQSFVHLTDDRIFNCF